MLHLSSINLKRRPGIKLGASFSLGGQERGRLAPQSPWRSCLGSRWSRSRSSHCRSVIQPVSGAPRHNGPFSSNMADIWKIPPSHIRYQDRNYMIKTHCLRPFTGGGLSLSLCRHTHMWLRKSCVRIRDCICLCSSRRRGHNEPHLNIYNDASDVNWKPPHIVKDISLPNWCLVFPSSEGMGRVTLERSKIAHWRCIWTSLSHPRSERAETLSCADSQRSTEVCGCTATHSHTKRIMNEGCWKFEKVNTPKNTQNL